MERREDILKFIIECFQKENLFWTYHVNMRLKDRQISRDEIRSAVADLEIIEEYPKDKYLPSYLLLAGKTKKIHLLLAVDRPGQNVRIITCYRPNPNEWTEDLRRRK